MEQILSKSISDKNINEDRILSPSRELVVLSKVKDYPSPAPSLSSTSLKSNASSKSNGSNKSNNESPKSNGFSGSPKSKLKRKKSVIDTFYQCDINAEGEKNPRTISVVDPATLQEFNPPRGISVIDSVIMPVPGESLSNISLNSFNDDYSDKTPSPNMNPLPSLNPSPSVTPTQIVVPSPVRASSMKIVPTISKSHSPVHASSSVKISPTTSHSPIKSSSSMKISPTVNLNHSPIKTSTSMKLSPSASPIKASSSMKITRSTSPINHISNGKNLKGSSSMKNLKTSPVVKGIKPSPTILNVKSSSGISSIKASPNMKAVRRNDDKGVLYSDDESFKTIKVVPNRALKAPNRNVKSPQEMELAESNKQVIDNSNGEFVPPPIPPFPSFPKKSKPYSHTRTSSLEHNFFKNMPITINSSKGKIVHSNTFQGRDKITNNNNFDMRSRTIDRVDYSKYNQSK